MSHEDTVRELVSILNPQNEARPTVLLGAGASFSSGVPLADESVKRIARRYYAERTRGKVLPELRRSRLFGQVPGRNKLKAGSRLLVSPFPEISFISCCCRVL